MNRRFVAAAMIALQNTPEASTSPPDRPRHNRLFAAPGPNEPTNHPFFSSLLGLPVPAHLGDAPPAWA